MSPELRTEEIAWAFLMEAYFKREAGTGWGGTSIPKYVSTSDLSTLLGISLKNGEEAASYLLDRGLIQGGKDSFCITDDGISAHESTRVEAVLSPGHREDAFRRSTWDLLIQRILRELGAQDVSLQPPEDWRFMGSRIAIPSQSGCSPSTPFPVTLSKGEARTILHLYGPEVEEVFSSWDKREKFKEKIANVVRTLEQPGGTAPKSDGLDTSFMHSDDVRIIFDRDYRELQKLLICGAYKAVIIMCGSIIEGLLLDSLKAERGRVESARAAQKGAKGQPIPLEEWDLGHLIDVAKELSTINPGTVPLSHAVREYRNLIHPGKEIRSGFQIGAEEAAGAKAFLDVILRDLQGSARRRRNP